MNRTHCLTRIRKLSLAPLAGATAALLAVGPATAQLTIPESLDSPLRPYYLQASQTLRYDSNLFRASSNEDSDIVSTTALVGGFDQRISRQRVFGSAGISGNLYQDNDQLDGVGYNLALGLAWEAGSSWSGNAGVRFGQNQASFANYGSATADRTGRNHERSTVLDASAQYGRGVLGLEVLANHVDVRYSDRGFANRDRTSDTVGAGLRYRPGGPWSFGLTARYTEGEYPDTIDLVTGGTQSDDYERRDIDLTAQYVASGRSSFSGRISYTDEEHDLVSARDFDGLTGALSWLYAITGKTTLRFGLERTTGTGTGTRLTSVPSTDPLAPAAQDLSFLTDSRRSDILSVGADWEATAKIAVTADASYSRDRYDTRFVEGTGGGTTGTSKTFNLGARYAITRAWSLGCGVGYYTRDTSISTSAGSFGYDSTSAYCTAGLRLQ